MTVPNEYHQYCWYRLPCGVCTRTNSLCIYCGFEITIKSDATTLTWMQTNADLTHSNTHDALEEEE